jgi:mono/diheme cytochrome c family protein
MPRDSEHFSGLHHRSASVAPATDTTDDDWAKPDDYTFSDMNTRSSIAMILAASAGVFLLALTVTLSAQHKPHTHRHEAAAKLTNPVPASAQSIAAGRKLYDRHCSECHGNTGKGDGMAGEGLDEKPSNLVDAEWEHGTTDGEMFVVIRDGAGPKSEMKGFAKKLAEKDIWDVVNFVRSLSPARSTPRKSH